jgi:hypothetical protein
MIERCARLALAVAVALTAACATSEPKPSTRPNGRPQVGWVVMSGDRDTPDRDFVCQSEPRNECAIPASSPDDQVFTHVYFYYHPAAVETHYEGSIQIGFLQGDPAANPLRVNATTPTGGKPVNQSIIGIVTNRAGSYPIRVAVDAQPIDGARAPTAFHEDIPVTVVGRAADH